jgi:16S rRNA (cytidine1402-2'-O)-methyltransferase
MPLIVCATPIGNLDDVSPRLLETLRTANVICAEDTRLTQRLLARYEIHTPLTSCHEHTSPAKIAALATRLEEGEVLALVTDSGTPGISDPGPALVREAASRGIEISPLPGPCALAAALSISGFDAQRFSFLGFLPRKPGKRRKALAAALARNETLVLYESPFRIKSVVEVIAQLAPDVPIVLCRELTKKFEETLRGSAREVLEVIAQRSEQRGEFVLIVAATDQLIDDEATDHEPIDREETDGEKDADEAAG